MSTRSRNELVEALRAFAEDQRGVVVMPDSGQLIPADHLLTEAADLLDSLEEREEYSVSGPGWSTAHPIPTFEEAVEAQERARGEGYATRIQSRSTFTTPWKDVEEVG